MSRTPRFEDAAMDMAERVARKSGATAVYFDDEGTLRTAAPDSDSWQYTKAVRAGRVIGFYTWEATEKDIHDDILDFLSSKEKAGQAAT